MFPSYGASLYTPSHFLLTTWTSRSFTECDDIPITASYKIIDDTTKDLIKSPTSPTAREHKQQEDDLSRRKSFEVADLHRVDRSSVCLDRFSTCLTPTATSFSTDELNEIFNIGRNNMNAAPIDLQNDLGEISPHNMPLNESSLSIDSSTCGTPFKTDEQHTENNADTSFNKSMPPPLDLHEISAIETPKHDSLMLNPRSPFTPSPDGRASFSPIQMVCREIFMTEKSYVNDLQEVIEGYIYHLKQQMELDVESIFGNLEDIYEFNKDVLYQLEQCETVDFEIDPIQLAMVFIEKARGFNHHYVKYCTNYPEASTFFAIIMQDPGIQHFFVERQKLVGHALPLESYLLKPVQRIMKYHLLFRDILKKYDGDEDGYDTLNTAVLAMSDVAEYINEMKRLHENAAKVQHILSKIIDLDVPIDVFETGRLVLENTFKVHGSRGDRIMYLFEKLLLICKKNEDKLYQFKEKIECSNMMLVESLPKDPLAFQIMRFDNQKVNYTIVAKSFEVKKDWTQHLKRLILENHAANIPQTARQAILGPEEKKKSKYNSLSITALDDSVMGHLRLTKSNQKSTLGKENVYVTTGMKRENNEKETSVAHAPKRSLNTKAKEYLMEKKSRNVANQSNAGTPSPDKDKKEKRWKKKHKHKPSLDSILILEDDASQKSLLMDSTSKSRSLESLKDSLRTQDSTENQEAIERNILQEIINHNFDKNDTTTPTSMKLHDESNGAENALNRNSQLYNEITDESCRDVVSESRNEFKARSISKSMSLNVPTTNKSVKNDDMKRWSKLSDTDPMELLEKRLSILNDDELSSASIKNMVRKVSNAFNSSFQAYDDSPRTVVSNEMDITRNMDILTGRADGAIKATNRRSTGEMSAPKVHVSSMRIGRSRSELSVYNENVKIDVKDFSTDNLETRNTVVDSEESNRWSADVDQVFDEVNADINSIADSLSSDANKSNESVSDSSETTTPDMNSNKRAALVDARLNVVANEERSSPSSTRKVNVEVKRVADRIKEYKKLIDAEKQRNSWRRREPRSMNEMIETLDSISTVNNGLSPVYSTHRRRFKSSRDYENDERRSSEDSNGSWSVSVIRSFSENYNPEKPTEISSPRINTKESLLRTSLTESLTSASDSSVGDHKTIKDIEIMKQRAQRYRDALQNFESRASVSDSPTPEYDTNCPEHNNNRPEHNNNRPEHNNNRPEQESRDLQNDIGKNESESAVDRRHEKANSLPNPRRANAIKRPTRQMSEDPNTKRDCEREKYLTKSVSLEAKRITRPLERTKPKSSRWVEAKSKNASRSSSVPPQNRHSLPAESTIHEELPSEYLSVRLNTRALSDSSSHQREIRRAARGRSDDVKFNRNSTKENVAPTKYLSLPRPRKKDLNKDRDMSDDERPTHSSATHRSTSLPRRSPNNLRNVQLEAVKKETDDNHNSILRSPSIRCIQQNHVNSRIKDYFTNLSKSSQVSRSRPNLLLVGSDSESEENDSSSTSLDNDGRVSPSSSTNVDHILRGTVRSMIKRYGQANYVFDHF